MQGAAGTFDYRLFMTEGGQLGSFWHDIPLENGDGSVNFVCEIPKETKAKMEVATVDLQLQTALAFIERDSIAYASQILPGFCLQHKLLPHMFKGKARQAVVSTCSKYTVYPVLRMMAGMHQMGSPDLASYDGNRKRSTRPSSRTSKRGN